VQTHGFSFADVPPRASVAHELDVNTGICVLAVLRVRHSTQSRRELTFTQALVLRGSGGEHWAGGMPLGLFKGERTFTLTERGGGTVEFRISEAFSGLLSPLIERSIPNLQPAFDEFAADLKKRAEAGLSFVPPVAFEFGMLMLLNSRLWS
jgi:hypothetical protein